MPTFLYLCHIFSLYCIVSWAALWPF
jgi:hypothetical protein